MIEKEGDREMETTSDPGAWPFLFVGNALWLDFVNTEKMRDGSRADLLDGYPAWVDWMVQAGVVADGSRALLLGRGEGETGVRILAQARELRVALRAVAKAAATGRSVPDDAVVAVNAWLARRRVRKEIARTEAGYELKTVEAWNDPADLLAAVAESAAEFICGDRLQFVRKCESDRCILHFYDNSKNHGRRWCRMSACGNRAKAAAHYHKHKLPE
jgi:predicted RNA-binding Zn ribbon-like protein